MAVYPNLRMRVLVIDGTGQLTTILEKGESSSISSKEKAATPLLK